MFNVVLVYADGSTTTFQDDNREEAVRRSSESIARRGKTFHCGYMYDTSTKVLEEFKRTGEDLAFESVRLA